MAIKLDPIQMDRKTANKLAKEYTATPPSSSTAIAVRPDMMPLNERALRQIDTGLHETYVALGAGQKVIDIRQVFRDAGQDRFQRPNIAIARADWRSARVERLPEGGLRFVDPLAAAEGSRLSERIDKAYRLPDGTLPELRGRVVYQSFTAATMVPPIPPKVRPDNLPDYALLWEVVEWTGEPRKLPSRMAIFRSQARARADAVSNWAATLDPILLRPLGGPLYVVVAAWDLSPIEATIIGSI